MRAASNKQVSETGGKSGKQGVNVTYPVTISVGSVRNLGVGKDRYIARLRQRGLCVGVDGQRGGNGRLVNVIIKYRGCLLADSFIEVGVIELKGCIITGVWVVSCKI